MQTTGDLGLDSPWLAAVVVVVLLTSIAVLVHRLWNDRHR